ncbi:hypothetical protein HMI01_01490 [Halolactibacillus miurensis]|uniref:Uncharacterized protein n=1 Tax=Halolactibacillus miurensis TaxID=306541 RepID=A0ABQ0VPU3_9BACI|nr:hypothetical protein HMI01_01490 [Halolactibacillus miurensis]
MKKEAVVKRSLSLNLSIKEEGIWYLAWQRLNYKEHEEYQNENRYDRFRENGIKLGKKFE